MTALMLIAQTSPLAQQNATLTPEEFFSTQLVTLLCWLTLGAMALLLFLGASDQVVIFFDANDVFWSLMPFGSLIGSFVILVSLQPSTDVQEVSFASVVLLNLVAIAGLLLAFVGVLITVHNAVRYNRSLPLGVLVGIFKMSIALLMIVTLVGHLFKASRSNTMIAFSWNLLAVGVLGWLWMRLVNGRRVYLQRGWAVEVDGQLWVVR